MKAQLTSKMMPAEMVTFDFNPESISITRTASSNSNPSPSGPKGATPSIFRGSQPPGLKFDAWLEGSDVKGRAEQLLDWCEPGGGLLGKAAGAVMGALTGGRMNLAAKLPVLIFTWGPFLMECVLTSVGVTYTRFDSSGEPSRAKVNVALKEEPSLLGLLPTNPTSGGPAGRKRHIVSHGDSLPLIAARSYGHPGLWRAVADANGIDDPFRMTPGRALLLPSVSELSSQGG